VDECLDEETILAFCRGDVAPARRPAIEKHIGQCDECRALVSAVARSSLVDPEELFESPLPPKQADLAMAPTTPLQGGFGASGPKRRSKPPVSPVEPGDVLAGKYLVERVLGVGGMGVVVAAKHTQLDQTVALKFLLPTACEVQGATARFLREGKAAARITSEHVARVVDTGTLDNGSPYLVMEYLDGFDLGELTESRGPLDSQTAAQYVLQACEAIVEAHQLGIVHRDLKPANLFLTRRKDGSPLVKVLDFGISKAEEGGSQSTALTGTSMMMGSPRYMSPEQMVSAKDVDLRTDVWALGVILFELITGRPVWQADTVQGLCALIATAKTPSLRALVPSAPIELENVILRCLEKAPPDRVQNVADLALLLEPVAPSECKVSVDRILAVAGRARGPVRDPLPAIPFSPPKPPADLAAMAATAMASSASVRTSPGGTSSGGRIALLLAIIVAALVLVGALLNTVFAKRQQTAEASQPPPPVLASSITAPPQPAASSVAATETAAPLPLPSTKPSTGRPSSTTPKPRHSGSSAVPLPAPPAPDRALSDRK
jgi:eukaryotic-like serine/threonine-protein kinase